jgi:hypothetical protein
VGSYMLFPASWDRVLLNKVLQTQQQHLQVPP